MQFNSDLCTFEMFRFHTKTNFYEVMFSTNTSAEFKMKKISFAVEKSCYKKLQSKHGKSGYQQIHKIITEF